MRITLARMAEMVQRPKTNTSHSLYLRVPLATYQRIEEMARQDDRKITYVAAKMLERGLEASR